MGHFAKITLSGDRMNRPGGLNRVHHETGKGMP